MSTKDQQITLLLEALLHEKKENEQLHAEIKKLREEIDRFVFENECVGILLKEAEEERDRAKEDLSNAYAAWAGTPSEETKEKKSAAGRKPALGRAEVEEIRALAKGKVSPESIAHSFNVSLPTVRRVLKGHGPYSKANGHG